MSNHIHLALVAGSDDAEHWLKRTHSPFAAWMNHRRDRLGPVFANRPAIWAVRPEREAQLIAYIHNNPVRAGVAAVARDSHWTSHRSYCGLAATPSWLDVRGGLKRCGFTTDRRARFDRWVAGEHGTGEERDRMAEARRAARKLGAIEVATPVIGAETHIPLMARPYARIWPDANRLVQRVADVVGLPAARFCSRSHAPELVSARRVAVCAAQALGLPIAAIASTLGISRQAAGDLARSIRDEREDLAITKVCRET